MTIQEANKLLDNKVPQLKGKRFLLKEAKKSFLVKYLFIKELPMQNFQVHAYMELESMGREKDRWDINIDSLELFFDTLG